MNKSLTLLLATFSFLLLITSVHAGNFRHGARAQADSDFRIAEKSYKKIIKNYGQSLSGLVDEEKSSACKRINSALYTNQHNMISEDIFRQRKLKEQISKLRQYSSKLECPQKN